MISFNKWPSIQYNSGYLLFFETTIMWKTADFAMVQRTIIDTLHKEGKSERVIIERDGCSRSAVSKHMKCKVYLLVCNWNCLQSGCHVICWCWSTVGSEVHSQRSHLPGNFRALQASFCWQALLRYWFHFPAGLGTCPHRQMYQKLVQWAWCYCAWLASKLAWPEPQRIYGVLSRRWETPDPTMQMTWRPLSKQPGLLLHLSSATGWLPSCHAALVQ